MPSMACSFSLISSPILGRSFTSATAMMSHGPVTVSTDFIISISLRLDETLFVFPTAVSMRMYARVAKFNLHWWLLTYYFARGWRVTERFIIKLKKPASIRVLTGFLSRRFIISSCECWITLALRVDLLLLLI